MTGLIWKDILVMQKNLRFYVLFLAAYFGLAVVGVFEITFVTTFSTVMLLMIPISSFSFDEAARWDRFARALPLGPRIIVGARYLFVVLILLGVSLFSILCALLFAGLGLGDVSLIENTAAVMGSMGAGLLLVDVMLPLCYKLGAERARPYLFAVFLIPFVVVFLLLHFGSELGLDLSFLNQLPELTALGLVGLFPLAALAGLGLSFLISCRIMDRKEF